jgi:hypothetical protein
MTSGVPEIFLPPVDSDAVKKLKAILQTENEAVRVKVAPAANARENECYLNVRDRLKNLHGARMQLGWAIWQNAHLFVEAEAHAVLDPGSGQPWIDCTPHIMPDGSLAKEILFIPDHERTYDYSTTHVLDNVRVPLIDDPRLTKALDLFAQRTKVLNTIPGIGTVAVPVAIAAKLHILALQAHALLAELMQPASELGTQISAQTANKRRKVGRNDPCPCESGKKYKKCCGK